MPTKQQFAIGDRIQLTGKFLRSTGQYTGREPASVWTVTGFSGSFIITDEPRPNDGMFSPEELASDPTLRFRRIAPGNVQLVRGRPRHEAARALADIPCFEQGAAACK